MMRSTVWKMVTDVSEKHTGPNFKGQRVQGRRFVLCWLYYRLKAVPVRFPHSALPRAVKEVPWTDPRHISLDVLSSPRSGVLSYIPLQLSVHKKAKGVNHVTSFPYNKRLGFDYIGRDGNRRGIRQ
jgi:hypothetical protein